ncbi:DUF6479 family protein [Streptomyces sp. ODS28]|uniref:DUF6479 family protein n=1 Tax=Streptomyces sp. ODS28 TaxID=3136688 RepID=UPI0031E75678
MYTYAANIALGGQTHQLLVGIAPFVVGLVVVAALILAVVYGMRLRDRGDMRSSEPGGPAPEEPVGDQQERWDSEEVPRDGVRRYPSELGSVGHRKDTDEPPRWNEGSSGGFGSGGPGHT